MELRTPALDPALAARKNQDQQQNINALNFTLSSQFLLTITDLKKQWTVYKQEVKSFCIHNHTGMKLSMRPEGDHFEHKLETHMYFIFKQN